MVPHGNHSPRDSSNTPRRGPAASSAARILVVGGPNRDRDRITRSLSGRGHECTQVARLDDGLAAVRNARFEIVLVHPRLPDGDGLALVEWIRDNTPNSKPIVFNESETLASTLAAVRNGAVDVITETKDVEDFVHRIEHALERSVHEQRREERVRRLQQVSRELESTRDEMTGQVNQLCHEMVRAYEDMTNQLDEVSMASEFRTLMRMELDVEEALRTALEYLLTRTGPTNAAVFLPDLDGKYSLGAYVNYDCPRDGIEPILGQMADNVSPQLGVEPAILNFADAEEFGEFSGIDDPFFDRCDVTAFSCRHDGECLAVVILFRNDADPFPPSLMGRLDTLRDIFAEHLARIIDVHHRAKPSWPDEDEGRWDDHLDIDDEPDWGIGGMAA